jgi:hypothetical protein
MLATPVLFIVFNRPHLTAKVLDSLLAIKPSVLYVAADGPRANKESDVKLCAETRALIESKVTWPCEIKKRFLDENLGCGKAVSTAISWFFSEVEYGIVLEDDCLPDASFYPFCEQLLLKYKDNNEIMHIGGANFQDGKKRGEASYYFSSEVHVWGWASWRRAWNAYDYNTSNLHEFISTHKIKKYYQDKKIINYWHHIFERMTRHEIDTWDYQWRYCIWNAGGLAIIPQKNLVSNIGFGADATHTSVTASSDNVPRQTMEPVLIHPATITRDAAADLYTFDQHYKPGIQENSLVERVVSKLKNVFR